ncbi:MAG: T9SS type A sorting domain-containing protein [Candidatus Kapabacteria bacterium]|nr:T9SS type A sorting domain-containing protein [Candidatus Kapabacteria bacterium]
MKHVFITVLCILSMQTMAQSQSISRDSLLQYIKTNAGGTEFWVSFPPAYEEVAGAENSTRIFVASSVRQPVTVEVPGKGWAMTKMAVANDVVEFKLPSNVGQPYSKPTTSKAPKEQVYARAGVHVVAEQPIAVYAMTRFQYTSDGFMGVPINGLGQDYVIGSWPQYTASGSAFKLPAVSNIVAAYDSTEVTFVMGGTPGSKTTGGLTAGQIKKWTLNAGDVICLANDDDGQDIAGSRVTSTKPVGVISGNQCANVPAGVPWCDFIADMELPTVTWGKEYHVTALVDRLLNPVIRVFAHPDYKDVKVYRDGIEWFTLENKNRTENQAFVERRLQDGPPKSTMISANAPIYIMLYNTGQADDNVSSDPFQYVITPVEQYQKEIIFATPNARGGTLPFTKNYVNLVYALGENDNIPDDLEFGTVINGQIEWRSVASRFGTTTGHIFSAPTSNGLKYGMKRITLPGDGVYRIRANQPFAAYSYGYSDYDSYGFPTSANLMDLTLNDTIDPVISVDNVPSILNNQAMSAVFSGKASDPMQNGKSSKLARVFLAPNYSKNIKFEINKIDPTKVTPEVWKATVIDTTRDARAVIIAQDRNGNFSYQDLQYSGKGQVLFQVPTPVEINTSLNKSTVQKLSINNTYSERSFTIKNIELTDSINFSIAKNTVIGKKIQAKSTLEVLMNFNPTGLGDFSTSVIVTFDNNEKINVDVKAKALRSAIAVLKVITFDSVEIDQNNGAKQETYVAPLNDNVTMITTITSAVAYPTSSISFNNVSHGIEGFQADISGLLNKKIKAGDNSLPFSISFKPVREGLHTAKMCFVLDGSVRSDTITVMGYGKKTATSVNEYEAESVVSIYPNPAKKQCTIQGIEGESTITIMNVLGEEKMKVRSQTPSVILSLESLPAGSYSVTVKNSTLNYTLPLTIVE